jgi:hypothetical protein
METGGPSSESRRDFLRKSALIAAAGFSAQFINPRIFAATTGATSSLNFEQPGSFKVQYYGKFSELPLGSVKPRGWIKSWLERQLDGLTGHPENLAYPYDTCMYTGKVPPPSVKQPAAWWPYEQSGYFVDGATRLSHLIDEPAASKIPQANLKYILANAGPSKLGESTWGWPNTVVGRALMAEYSATGNPAIPQAVETFFQGDHSFAGRDGYIFEEALYWYGLSGDPSLLDVAKRAYDHYFVSDPKSFSQVNKIHGEKPLHEHGVTAAEQLKLLPLMYSYTGDQGMLDLANVAYGKILHESLMPDGGIVSSEALGTTAFNSLHETCDITDWSWSLGYMLMASGDGQWADVIERATFNALPGAVTKDFKQVQYFSSPNQVLTSSTVCPRIAMTRMSYRAAHETPCCAGNVNRAMPNYVSRMWMRAGGGLAAALFGPCVLNTTVKGQPICIEQDTDYPFRETITFRLKTQGPVEFPLALRIPDWCHAASITVNESNAGVDCKPGAFAVIQRNFQNGDQIVLSLPMQVQLEPWFAGSAATVKRGPLVYSLKIDEKRVESQTDPEPIRRVLKGNNIQGFPAVEFFPNSEWRYGMDAAQINSPQLFKAIESPMTDNPFLAEQVPVHIESTVRGLPQWAAAWKPVMDPPPSDLKQSPKNPVSLPAATEMQTIGASQPMRFVPYGATHLRLTTLPVIKT